MAALGLLAIGCGPSVALPSDADGDDGNDGPFSSGDTSDPSGPSDDGSTPTGDGRDDGSDEGIGEATADSDDDADDGSDDITDDGSDEGPPTTVCADGVPILQTGVDGSVPTGFDRCGDGSIVRTSVVSCDQPEPLGRACTLPDQSCSIDADCTDGAFGRCTQQVDVFGEQDFCGCVYGCEVDSDCIVVQPQPCAKCECAGAPLAAREAGRFRDAVGAVVCPPYDLWPGEDCGGCVDRTVFCDSGRCSTR